MKLVSTTNIEFERSPGLKNRKHLECEGEGKNMAFEFSLLMCEPSLNSETLQESILLATNASDLEVEVENNTSQVEQLAATPVNDRKLMEGFEIFGSVFSLLQVESSVTAEDVEVKPDLLDLRQLSEIPRSSGDPHGLGAELTSQDDAVVIDFATIRRKTAVLPQMTGNGIDRAAVVPEAHRSDLLKQPERQFELKSKEQLNARGALVFQLHPKDENLQVDDVRVSLPAENTELENLPVTLNSQPASSGVSRVDQVVRFVFEKSAELFGTTPITHERDTHATLTGKTLRLSLHPAELGSVEVSVSRRGKRLEVTIASDLESTARLLLKDSEQLVMRLGLAHGVNDHVHVHITTREGAFEVQASDNQPQFSGRSERGRDSQNGQHNSPQTPFTDRQDMHKSDEKHNSKRADNAVRHVGGDIYI